MVKKLLVFKNATSQISLKTVQRTVQRKLMPFIFKLAANVLLEFVCFHVYSQHEVVDDCKSTVSFKFLQLKCI